MNYYFNTENNTLVKSDIPFGFLIQLPIAYQAKRFEDIKATKWGGFIAICHPELAPYIWLQNEWVRLVLSGKDLIAEKTINVRPSPTEQREAFQKKYPHLVKKVDGPADSLAPKHYTQGKIEPWDFITSQNMSFLEGNIIKYITRYKQKNGIEDLFKAQTYLNKLISEVICTKKLKD